MQGQTQLLAAENVAPVPLAMLAEVADSKVLKTNVWPKNPLGLLRSPFGSIKNIGNHANIKIVHEMLFVLFIHAMFQKGLVQPECVERCSRNL